MNQTAHKTALQNHTKHAWFYPSAFTGKERDEETFDSDYGRQLMHDWGVPLGYVARCFVLLGYCKGEYPAVKPRRQGRYNIVEAD